MSVIALLYVLSVLLAFTCFVGAHVSMQRHQAPARRRPRHGRGSDDRQ